MSYYNPDWYYTAGPDCDDEDEYEDAIAADEDRWEYERGQELVEGK